LIIYLARATARKQQVVCFRKNLVIALDSFALSRLATVLVRCAVRSLPTSSPRKSSLVPPGRWRVWISLHSRICQELHKSADKSSDESDPRNSFNNARPARPIPLAVKCLAIHAMEHQCNDLTRHADDELDSLILVCCAVVGPVDRYLVATARAPSSSC
jgi:hypothetical protein